MWLELLGRHAVGFDRANEVCAAALENIFGELVTRDDLWVRLRNDFHIVGDDSSTLRHDLVTKRAYAFANIPCRFDTDEAENPVDYP